MRVRPGFFADIGVAHATFTLVVVLVCMALAIWHGLH